MQDERTATGGLSQLSPRMSTGTVLYRTQPKSVVTLYAPLYVFFLHFGSSPDLHPVQNKQHHQREHRPKDAVNERLQMVQEDIAVASPTNFVCCERKVLLCPIQFSDQRFNLLLKFFGFLNRQIDPPELDSGQRNCSLES
jgi:hypothetical protein